MRPPRDIASHDAWAAMAWAWAGGGVISDSHGAALAEVAVDVVAGGVAVGEAVGLVVCHDAIDPRTLPR